MWTWLGRCGVPAVRSPRNKVQGDLRIMEKLMAKWFLVTISVFTAVVVTLSGFHPGLQAAQAAEEIEETLAGEVVEGRMLLQNWDCDPILTPGPVLLGYQWFDCDLPPVYLTYAITPYSGIYQRLEDCDQETSNPSYYIKVNFNMCDEGVTGGYLNGYSYATGPLLYSSRFETTDNNIVASECFDSCNWPGYWELVLDNTTEGLLEAWWYVGCCACETYDDPCI